MPEYRRAIAPGATFFFTLVTYNRRPILTGESVIKQLRQAFRREKSYHPFEIDAIVVLPDHLHCILTLPPNDTRFAVRWTGIKGEFTRSYLASGGRESPLGASRSKRREHGVWQRRFWEHVIRDETDFVRHMDYILYNPIKHGYTECAHAWPYSSFGKWVRAKAYEPHWMCACEGRRVKRIDFSAIESRVGE